MYTLYTETNFNMHRKSQWLLKKQTHKNLHTVSKSPCAQTFQPQWHAARMNEKLPKDISICSPRFRFQPPKRSTANPPVADDKQTRL